MSRWFFALWPNAAVQKELAQRCAPWLARCGGHGVPPEKYHLTLAFLGALSADELAAAREAAAGVAFGSLALRLARPGSFRRAGVLWIAPDPVPEALTRLAAELHQALRSRGLPVDSRPFRPHVTLSRRITREAELSTLREAVAWEARGFVLVQSVSRGRETEYSLDQAFGRGSCNEL